MIWKTFLLLWVCELGVYLFATTHRNQPYKSQSQLAYYGILCKTYSAAAADKIEPKKIKWLLENVKLLYRYSEICTRTSIYGRIFCNFKFYRRAKAKSNTPLLNNVGQASAQVANINQLRINQQYSIHYIYSAKHM